MEGKAQTCLDGRLYVQKLRTLQRVDIDSMKSATDGAFETGHIGKVDQRRSGPEALQEFRKTVAVEIEPGGVRWLTRDEDIRCRSKEIRSDQLPHGRKIQAQRIDQRSARGVTIDAQPLSRYKRVAESGRDCWIAIVE